MATLEYVSAEVAQSSGGTRIVTSEVVPSPWSEAAKGLFEVARLPAIVVARPIAASDGWSWTGADNVPVVLHENEPPRTNWAAIVGLVARLSNDTLVPAAPAKRAEMVGAIEMIAGEQ